MEYKQAYKSLGSVKQPMRQKHEASERMTKAPRHAEVFGNCIAWLPKFGGTDMRLSRDKHLNAWYIIMLNAHVNAHAQIPAMFAAISNFQHSPHGHFSTTFPSPNLLRPSLVTRDAPSHSPEPLYTSTHCGCCCSHRCRRVLTILALRCSPPELRNTAPTPVSHYQRHRLHGASNGMRNAQCDG